MAVQINPKRFTNPYVAAFIGSTSAKMDKTPGTSLAVWFRSRAMPTDRGGVVRLGGTGVYMQLDCPTWIVS